MKPLAVLGAGAWGTALALAFSRAGSPVRLWGRDPAGLAAMAADRQNSTRLPGLTLPPSIAVEPDLGAALAHAEVAIAAVPAQALRDLVRAASPHLGGAPLVICAKGIERGTGRFLSEVAAEEHPGCLPSVLSGPSFATDVGRGLPTAVTLAATTSAAAASLAERLAAPGLRLYHTDDIRGVEVGGAAKNVLAIACGIATGRVLGASAVAALTARAFAELARFGRALGGRAETLAGLSGLGDLVLTCGSAQSRNFAYGLALGEGRAPKESGVVEGVWTAPVLVEIARRHGIEMPVAAAVADVLAGRLTVDDAVEQLMNRPMRAEG